MSIGKRAALYLRTSVDSRPSIENQNFELKEYASKRGFNIVEEYRDEGISGNKESRPALNRLMKDARARKFDIVVVSRFDRMARNVSHLIRVLDEFQHLGVEFVSLSEAVDTTTPMGRMLFTVIGAVAELELNLITERIHRGLNRAKRQGKQLGRPRRIFDRETALELLKTMSVRTVAKRLGVSRGVIERLVRTRSQI